MITQLGVILSTFAMLSVNSAKNLIAGNETLRSAQGDNIPERLSVNCRASFYVSGNFSMR